jgi:uncharacterized membrane protein YdjX (TVP38/TMEM64 family)
MILAVMSPVPDFVVSVAGGYLFGPFWGTVLALIGHAAGTSYNFFLARKLGRHYLSARFPHLIRQIDAFTDKVGWQAIALIRIVPSVSFDLAGYAAGISKLKYSTFIAASLLGTAPMAIMQNFLGRSFRTHGPSLPWMIIGYVILILLITVGYRYYSHHYRHRQ